MFWHMLLNVNTWNKIKAALFVSCNHHVVFLKSPIWLHFIAHTRQKFPPKIYIIIIIFFLFFYLGGGGGGFFFPPFQNWPKLIQSVHELVFFHVAPVTYFFMNLIVIGFNEHMHINLWENIAQILHKSCAIFKNWGASIQIHYVSSVPKIIYINVPIESIKRLNSCFGDNVRFTSKQVFKVWSFLTMNKQLVQVFSAQHKS